MVETGDAGRRLVWLGPLIGVGFSNVWWRCEIVVWAWRSLNKLEVGSGSCWRSRALEDVGAARFWRCVSV